MAPPAHRPRLRDLAVVAPNLHARWSGVTSTIVALVPRQARYLPIASMGPNLPPDVPVVPVRELFTQGWSRPQGKPFRIWHARRNDEMIVGIVLRDVLRQPWRLVFTSAALRHHTPFTRRLIARMDAVIATSEYAAAYLEREPTVIHHGVDLERFHPPEDRAAEWAHTGLPGTRGVGCFGRMRDSKGTDLFVEAMIRLLPRYPDVTAVLTGATDDAAFVERLKDRISASGLASRIRLLGERPSVEVPLWFSSVSVYVAPQRWEGFGLTPLEAMASGTAVVATRTGAAPLLVEDGETGRLVEPNDLDALTLAIEPLIASPRLAERMGAEGRRKAEARHDIDGEVRAINAVYEALWRAG